MISLYPNGVTTPPYVIGIHHYEHCFGADCNDLVGIEKSHPSGMRAITPYLKNLISNKKALYP